MEQFTMLYVLVLTLSIVHPNLCGIAPTWNLCQCRWDNWTPWSSCTKTCGGGYLVRERKVWLLDTPFCDSKFERCATNDLGFEWRFCNTECFHGGTIKTYQNGSANCDCTIGYKGGCCEQVVECGSPSGISNGHVIGNEFTYGKSVQYACNEDYNMTNPSDADRTCTENGYWTGKTPVCLYAVSCESNPCKNGAICTDTLGGYNCTCDNGWTGKTCEIDSQPPVWDSCPDDILVITSNMTHTETWHEPSFQDPFGGEVIVTKNYQTSTFTFPWGNYTVQYSAVKPSNGLTTECKFSIAIQPHACAPIEVPEDGILVCNGWQRTYTNICKLLCKEGFAYPPGFSETDWYNCGASGHWFPSIMVSRCVNADLRTSGSMPSLFECNTDDSRQAVANYYLTTLKNSAFRSLCDKHSTECLPDNVDIEC